MDKAVRKYCKIYKAALKANEFTDVNHRAELFEIRFQKMISSNMYAKHNVYPTMDMTKIYAVIAMCLELKNDDYSDSEIIKIINSGFKKLKAVLAAVEKGIDLLPNCYQIVKKWNINDYQKRIQDGSIEYDFFRVSEGKIEYRISRCKYIEIFETYGIKSLCKIFCLTDESAYSNLTKHVKFIRHSDLSEGECCHDEVIDLKHDSRK